MGPFIENFNHFVAWANGFIWHPWVLLFLLGVGVLFTIKSGFVQYRSLTHGTAIVTGKYSHEEGPGAINHFQALTTALSATVGVGNISGIALGIALGGPGAVFWMWVVGFLGMAIKSVEVTQAMTFRNTEEPDNPHGGPMWVAAVGLASIHPKYKKIGLWLGGIFCVTLLIATITGGLVFQAWSAATVAQTSFGIPQIATGLVLCSLVGCVILGGISRVGQVTGSLVPIMCGLYLLAAVFIIITHLHVVPQMFSLIFQSAFGHTTASGAFIGGSVGIAFSEGLKRAFFSNEAGQGSSSIAHAAVRTKEPTREGLVAGLEPFIDTLVVCTLTALVILISGSWNRSTDIPFENVPAFSQSKPGQWSVDPLQLPKSDQNWQNGDQVFIMVAPSPLEEDAYPLTQLTGTVSLRDGKPVVSWPSVSATHCPTIASNGFFMAFAGASLTAFSFERMIPGWGSWLVALATLFFATSTMISWSYYGEQGVVFLFGTRAVMFYRLIFCILIPLTTLGLIRDINDIANLSMLGTGAMLFVNVPIMLIFARQTMKKHHRYWAKLKSGQQG